MTLEYRSLDRSTHTVIFFASLIVTIGLIGSVVSAFGPIAAPQHLAGHMESRNLRG